MLQSLPVKETPRKPTGSLPVRDACLHNLDVMKQADWIIDIGPDGGKNGGEVVFAGTPMDMVRGARTLTADSLRSSCRPQDRPAH